MNSLAKTLIVIAVWFGPFGAGAAWAQSDPLTQNLKPGAEVFDARGQAIGIVTGVELDGSVVVRELHVSPTGMGTVDKDVLRVLPPGAVDWTGHGLKTNLTLAQVDQLSTPEDGD